MPNGGDREAEVRRMKKWIGLCLLLISACLTGYAQDVRVIHVDEPGTLAEKIAEIESLNPDETVKITGELYNSDFKAFGEWKGYSLTLDLSEAVADTIPEDSFYEFSLKNIVLPKVLTRIETRSFYCCKRLEKVDFSLCGNLEYIGKSAFWFDSKLLHLNFSSCVNLEKIDEYAFAENNLIDLDLSKCINLKSIGDAAFVSTLISTIILPPFVEEIGIQAFMGCRFKSIELPASIKKLGKDSFRVRCLAVEGLTELTVILKATVPMSTQTSPFDGYDGKVKLIVPVGCKTLYEKAPIWSLYDIREVGLCFIKVENNGGGSVKIGEKIIQSGEISVTEASDVQSSFIPDRGYCLKQVKLNAINVTNQVENNILIIPQIVENKELRVVFEKEVYSVKVSYNGGGSVKVNEQNITSGSSVSIAAGTDVKLAIIPNEGFKLQQVLLGTDDVTDEVIDGTLSIPMLSESKDIVVRFEKTEAITFYSVKVTYNTGGTVKVNDKPVTSGSSEMVNASTDVTVSIVPNAGYHVKSVKLGETDVTLQVSSENTLVISSISSNQELSVAFEQDAPVTYSVKVTYNTGGAVKVNDKPVASGSSETVNASTDVTVSIVPNAGYHIKSVKLGETDVTSQVSSENTLVISSISSNQELSVTFEQDAPATYTVKVTYNTGGTVKVNDKTIPSGSSETVNTSTDVTISIVPASGYHVKSVELGATDVTSQVTGDNTLVISSISEDKELVVVFEQTTYIVKVTYNAGGTVKVNNSPIANGAVETVNALTDVQVSMIPNEGYLLKQVKLGEADVTDQIVNHILTISEIAGDREVTVVFEKGTPVTYSLKVSYSDGGTVKVNNLLVGSGTSLAVTKSTKVSVRFVPDEGFVLKQVLLDGVDVTNQLVGNVLEIPTVSADLEIVVFFEEIPMVSCIVNIVGNGVVKVNEQQIKNSLDFVSVEKGEAVTFSFTPDAGYELGKVLMNNQEITSQVKNNTYRIAPLISDVTCQVEFVLKEDPTSIDPVPNATKRVYRSAPRRLVLSGFEAGVPVYVYDGSGRLVVLKTIRDSVEVVDVPSDGLYFVRIGKESFKVVL